MAERPPSAKNIELWPVERLVPYARNARTHSDRQIDKIAASIAEFGFTNPILVDSGDGILAGHGRLAAAKRLGLTEVPVVILDHLTDKQRRTYILSDNKLALDAGWDFATLRGELAELDTDDWDLSLTGFDDDELASLLGDDTPETSEQGNSAYAPNEEEIPAPDNNNSAIKEHELEPNVTENQAEPPEETVPLTAPKRVTKGQVWKLGRHTLVCGDSSDAATVHRHVPEHVGHAIVTDPPYGLGEIKDLDAFLSAWLAGSHDVDSVGKGGFMNKEWDRTVPPPALWKVWASRARPGAHALVFSGTRTQDLMTLSLRIAGLEIRDCLAWIYAQGFPKNHDISKAIDKEAGATRELMRVATTGAGNGSTVGLGTKPFMTRGFEVTAPATPEAKQWDGFGTALKPSQEPITLARVPLSEDTIAGNVLKHGTGGLNIDGCRVEGEPRRPTGLKKDGSRSQKAGNEGWDRPWKNDDRANRIVGDGACSTDKGRWPANAIFDPEAAEMLDEQSGILRSGGTPPTRPPDATRNAYGAFQGQDNPEGIGGSEGGASRFFFVAKPSRAEREGGLENFIAQTVNDGRKTDIDNPYQRGTTQRLNTHPTVKPLRLMQHLVRLVTPPGGVVLEPFCGSGTTLLACEREGFSCFAFEQDPAHCDIILARFETLTGLVPTCVEG